MLKLLILLLATGLTFGIQTATAEEKLDVSALTSLDRDFMADQRDRIDSLARIHLGRQINSEKSNNLEILQLLMDRRLVKPAQTVELQAMGVVMGDLFAKSLGMEWLIYSDRLGRSRALHIPNTDKYLFPITMISRRAEADARVDVEAIYRKAYSLMLPYKRKLPFQY